MKKLPKATSWLFKKLIRSGNRETVIGDIEEEYALIHEESGSFKANLWYFSQLLPLFDLISGQIFWSTAMFKNYMKISWRNIKKQKGYSIINISGLAIGMACTILLMIYIQSELNYDSFHVNRDRIYRMGLHTVTKDTEFTWFSSNAIAAGILQKEFPEVEATTRIRWEGRPTMKYGDNVFSENRVIYADPAVLDIFTFPLIKGSRETALNNPFSVVITVEMAEKYFGNEEPLGKTITFNNQYELQVTGVLETMPRDTDYRYNMIISFETVYSMLGRDHAQLTQWNSFTMETIVLLKPGVHVDDITSQFPAIVEKYSGEKASEVGQATKYLLQPFTDIHLRTPSRGQNSGGAIMFVYIFMTIALFIILIACVNFINLSTARSMNRAREVGLRKVFGAARPSLIKQFLSESFILSFIAMLISLVLVYLGLPYLSESAGREFDFGLETLKWLIPSLFVLLVFIGITAGAYPSFLLSSFKPVSTLQDRSQNSRFQQRFRKALVILQFVITIVLLTGTVFVGRQIDFMKNMDPGYTKEQVIIVPIRNSEVRNSIPLIKEIYTAKPEIITVGAATNYPGEGAQYNGLVPEGFSEDEMQLADDINVDKEYFDALDIQLVKGRLFTGENGQDVQNSVILNETTAKNYGWDEPIGKTIRIWRPYNSEEMSPLTVVGVIKDFHTRPLTRSMESVIICNDLNNRYNLARYFIIKIASGTTESAISGMRSSWQELFPEQPFAYYFLDNLFEDQFWQVQRSYNIFSYFMTVAIFIACLGLFGLTSFTAEQRKKEISIRKTLGAKTQRLVYLLNKETLTLVGIAHLFAWPVIYYLLNNWLAQFPYRTDISISVFLYSMLLIFGITMITVAFQSVRAANANPVDALRQE